MYTNLKVDTEKCGIDSKCWAFDTRGCQIPTTPILQPEWGVVVHNIDRCVNLLRSTVLEREGIQGRLRLFPPKYLVSALAFNVLLTPTCGN